MEELTAILIATGEADNLYKDKPSPLWCIADKPIIIHILENLSKTNIKTFNIILHHFPAMIENVIRNGDRWGVNIKYHLVKSGELPYKTLPPILLNTPSKNYLLGQADYLPFFPPHYFEPPISTSKLLYREENWSGWGILPFEILKGIDPSIPCFELPSHIGDFQSDIVQTCISTQTVKEIISSNESILSHKDNYVSLPTTAYSPENSIWLSHGAIIHPSVKLIGPLFIGEQCKINARATIGPNAIIEKRSLIDKNSIIENSVICRDSYVGEGLTIQDSIVAKNILINANYGTPVTIHEGFILSELTPPSLLHYSLHYLGRLVALLIFIIISPLMLLFKLIYGSQTHSFVFLPQLEGITRTFNWTYLKIPSSNFFSFLCKSPGLLALARGDLHWVGVSAKTSEEIENLPYYWKKLYCQSKVGYITLADLDYKFEDLVDERYASDIFYAANSSITFDAKVILRWLFSPFGKLFHKRI